MKTMIMFLVMLMIATIAIADPIPTYEFNNETCILTINPNENSLDGWFVCVSEDGLNIGLHNTAEDLQNCGYIIEAENEVDLNGIADCGNAVSNEILTWGTLKVFYGEY